MRVCHSINIINDDVCESDPNEHFFSDLALRSGMPPINILPMTARVIIDDTAEPECKYTMTAVHIKCNNYCCGLTIT